MSEMKRVAVIFEVTLYMDVNATATNTEIAASRSTDLFDTLITAYWDDDGVGIDPVRCLSVVNIDRRKT